MGAHKPEEFVRDKMDVTLWCENPLVIVDLTVHTQCGACYGVIAQISRALGNARIKYSSEDEEFFSKGTRSSRSGLRPG